MHVHRSSLGWVFGAGRIGYFQGCAVLCGNSSTPECTCAPRSVFATNCGLIRTGDPVESPFRRRKGDETPRQRDSTDTHNIGIRRLSYVPGAPFFRVLAFVAPGTIGAGDWCQHFCSAWSSISTACLSTFFHKSCNSSQDLSYSPWARTDSCEKRLSRKILTSLCELLIC